MHALTNSGVLILAVLIFFFLIFLAELSYIFCRRTGSFNDPPSPRCKEVILQFFMCCKKKNNRTGIASVQMETAEEVEVDVDVKEEEKWRVSRLLFTIQEEDLEMEDDEEGELQVDIPMEYTVEPTPFMTPSDSPPYFTPSPSPGWDTDDSIDVYDVISRSRDCCFNFQSS